ncbi:hypothetical protein Poli38472_007243 [Pythium oligandrum]|uniref:NADP-dependent oxidoreductase domain-containing protein n=1 Tax=Pythium oligandrum TaxID=41045 RepID=A0A8K1FHT9_PYTOL|nr:hypothetical protein Poli38472_007243 [Pythium oligandrum]|eukprot:TMW59098.1 hypothetical protein Poli38472_007243 [Pythium oligandrum]
MTSTTEPVNNMKYRLLGDTGLLVSRFSYGWFMIKDRALSFDQAYDVATRAYKHGVNFFDTAELYAEGESEKSLGQVVKAGIERGVWTREDLVISTKIFWGTDFTFAKGLNSMGLSRKHLVEGTKASLKRLGLDYVDLIFCHRSDPCTPIEETVRAMNYIIEQGWAFYWGTSEWSAGDILEACEIADRLGLIRPVYDQAQYNIFERSRVEYEYAPLYKKYKYGLTTWSPLAGGILTGKYTKGIPKGSRMDQSWYKGMEDVIMQKAMKTDQMEDIAKDIGCTLPQLALAWCAANDNVSTVLFSATTVEQLDENMKALAFIDKITPEIKAKIDAIVQFQPELVPQYPSHVVALRGKYLKQ